MLCLSSTRRYLSRFCSCSKGVSVAVVIIYYYNRHSIDRHQPSQGQLLLILFVVFPMRNLKNFRDITQYACGEMLLESHVPPMTLTPLPQTLAKQIQVLASTAAKNKIVSLSANQIRINQRMFAVLKHSLVQPGKWNNYPPLRSQDYQIVINPELKQQSNLRLKDFEECPSFPGLRFHIWNPVSQIYQYHVPIADKKGQIRLEARTATLVGFRARVWDHEVRHLTGILPIDREISHCEFSVTQEFKGNPGMLEMVQTLKQQVNLMRPQNLKKMMAAQKGKTSADKSSSGLSPKQMPDIISDEMKGRLSSEYRRYRRMVEQQSD